MARKLIKNSKGQNLSGNYGNLGQSPKSAMLPGLTGKNMRTLKKPVKWTPIKLILFLIFVFAPYSALLVVASGISKVLLIYLLAIPTLAGLGIYLLYQSTKN